MPPPSPALTPLPVDDAAIAGRISAAALAAGHRYVRQGRVRRLAMAEDGRRIEAETQGTQRKPYRQDITLRAGADGLIGFTGHCSCPVRSIASMWPRCWSRRDAACHPWRCPRWPRRPLTNHHPRPHLRTRRCRTT